MATTMVHEECGVVLGWWISFSHKEVPNGTCMPASRIRSLFIELMPALWSKAVSVAMSMVGILAIALALALLPPPSVADDLVVVRTINTHRCGVKRLDKDCPGDEYRWRLRGIADKLKTNYPAAVDLVGLQEVAGETSCLLTTKKVHGPACFAKELGQAYSDAGTAGLYSTGNQVGIVVGGEWEVLGWGYWEVGWWFDKRYLIETRLRHKTKGYLLRFYSTHVSNTSAGKRERQIRDVVAKVRDRASSGELPPIVVGDFNASRDFSTGEAETSVRLMEAHFWRPIDSTKPTGKLPIDMVYVGKKSSFPNSVKNFEPVQPPLYVRLTQKPGTVPGYPNFPYQLTDHDAHGYVLKVIEYVAPPPPPPPPPNCGQKRCQADEKCCEPNLCVPRTKNCP